MGTTWVLRLPLLLCARMPVCVQVQKESVYDAFYKLTNPHQQISSYIFDVVRTPATHTLHPRLAA